MIVDNAVDTAPAFEQAVRTASAELLTMADEIVEYEEGESDTPMPQVEKTAHSLGHSVFVVHGHDQTAKNDVELFIRRLKLEPLFLDREPNAGDTIIEKFERVEQKARFAIVILTGDDCGYAKKEGPKHARPRARQNAILELGYFLGKLGRSRVCALYEEEVELPSDIKGWGYVSYDKNGVWKRKMESELGAAGFDIDLDKIL